MHIRGLFWFNLAKHSGFWGNQNFWMVSERKESTIARQHKDRVREGGRDWERLREGARERGQLSPQAILTQTDNFKVKTVVYLVKGKGVGEKKREKFI